MEAEGPGRVFPAALFTASAVGIAFQIVLMRIFSIAHWHHFAYMIISIAMLGFGAAGTVLTFVREKIKGKEFRWFTRCSFLLALSVVVSHEIASVIPFETLHMLTGRIQLLHLFILYATLALPFFLASSMVSLGFLINPRRIGWVYSINLTGSGAGAAAAVGLLFLVPPHLIPYLLAVPVAAVSLALAAEIPGKERAAARVLLVAAAAWIAVKGPCPQRVSQYKALAYTMQYPDAEVVARSQSPLSSIVAVRSLMIRETPGQLSGYPMSELGDLPEQAGIFFDGAAVSVINRFDGDISKLAWLDYVTPALGYRITNNPDVLIIGAGGGTDVLMALRNNARRVTAVEVDPGVFTMVNRHFPEFSGGIYRSDAVETVHADGRGFLQGTEKRYDMIQIALLEAFNAASAGVYALSESYLYTQEAMELCIEHLTESGVLSVTRWVKTPPRDALRMFAVMASALAGTGEQDPGSRMAMIRSWNAATIIVSGAALTQEQIDSIRTFAERRWFDLCWYPGITLEETNTCTVLPEPWYYLAAKEILSGGDEAFYDCYMFDVSPPTDDSPYFFQFFKWNTLLPLTREMGLKWIPFMEWGYIILMFTILQSAAATLVIILLPLAVLSGKRRGGGVKKWVVLYFGSLGMGFMFLEMGFIQRFMLFLSYPAYAVAVVLTGLLVFSGLGSRIAGGSSMNRIKLVKSAVAGLSVVAVAYMFVLPVVFRAGASWPDAARIVTGLGLLFPPAFLMGIPFPSGMQLVSGRFPDLVPWAWGINGSAGVMGASLATFTAIHLGFRHLTLIAIVIYITAAVSLGMLNRARGSFLSEDSGNHEQGEQNHEGSR